MSAKKVSPFTIDDFNKNFTTVLNEAKEQEVLRILEHIYEISKHKLFFIYPISEMKYPTSTIIKLIDIGFTIHPNDDKIIIQLYNPRPN
jgi:hypothetical protein